MVKSDFSPLPPAEAIRFFQKKGYKFGFDWRDVWKEEHAVAFTVAKAMQIYWKTCVVCVITILGHWNSLITARFLIHRAVKMR